MTFLMWEYKNLNSGRFHSAANATERDEMVAQGMFDATKADSWGMPYPTGKSSEVSTPPVTLPLEVVPVEASPVDATVAPVKAKKTIFTKKKA